jgi:hypothetical protein
MKTLAIVLLAVAALGAVAFGTQYLTASEFTPVHAYIAGKSWQQVEPHMQALILGMIKVMGAGYLGGGAALLCLAYRVAKGDRWPMWGAPLIAGAVWGPTLYVTLWMREVRPGAETPVAAIVVLLAIVSVAALSLALHYYRRPVL